MADAILVINAGSSSLKFQVFALDSGELEVRFRGLIDGIGTRPNFAVKDAEGAMVLDRPLNAAEGGGPAECLAFLGGWLREAVAGTNLVGVGHRVVHGGALYSAPVRIDAQVLAELEKFVPLAPLHQPHNLAPIRALMVSQPTLPQVACFDTAFHRTQPIEAELFALPKHFYDEGVLRYGFHGLSYEYIASQLPRIAPKIANGRVVVAHLGSGVSMCALAGGRSVATTMGFTALDGCPMGTRCGRLDPGVVIYLARERGMSMDEIEALLYRKSGLLGISGVSNDMRDLLESEASGAKLAVDYFVYRIACELGSLAAALGGLDGIVFTAGVGENSAVIRARICERVAWLGLEFDAGANESGGPRISRPGSRVSAWVIPTNEELMIARQTRRVLAGIAPGAAKV
jgi:acetate kinase